MEDGAEPLGDCERLERGGRVGDRDEAAAGGFSAQALVGLVAEDRVQRQRLDRAAGLARHEVERRGGVQVGERARRWSAAPSCPGRAARRQQSSARTSPRTSVARELPPMPSTTMSVSVLAQHVDGPLAELLDRLAAGRDVRPAHAVRPPARCPPRRSAKRVASCAAKPVDGVARSQGAQVRPCGSSRIQSPAVCGFPIVIVPEQRGRCRRFRHRFRSRPPPAAAPARRSGSAGPPPARRRRPSHRRSPSTR